jgi:dTDP-4-dehydrorhamnose 3,5-epimerase
MKVQDKRFEISPVLRLWCFYPEINVDFRGENVEAWREDFWEGHTFVQCSFSVSTKDTLRGLHGDDFTDKLVFCTLGRVYLVVVEPNSRKWESFIIDDKRRMQVLIPKGYLNGHLCLSDMCIFTYMLTATFQGVDEQMTRRWDDPAYGIWWPISNPRLSERDAKAEFV